MELGERLVQALNTPAFQGVIARAQAEGPQVVGEAETAEIVGVVCDTCAASLVVEIVTGEGADLLNVEVRHDRGCPTWAAIQRGQTAKLN